MQGNIRIVLTLSILKNKNTVTTDWKENKINKLQKPPREPQGYQRYRTFGRGTILCDHGPAC